MFAHGGLFTTKGVAQRFLAAAIDTPVAVGATAAEGGAWGIAVLAAFLTRQAPGQGLAEYLTSSVFAGAELDEITPDPADVAGFDAFLQRYSPGDAGAAVRRRPHPKGRQSMSITPISVPPSMICAPQWLPCTPNCPATSW